jgi:hypothetical protein
VYTLTIWSKHLKHHIKKVLLIKKIEARREVLNGIKNRFEEKIALFPEPKDFYIKGRPYEIREGHPEDIIFANIQRNAGVLTMLLNETRERNAQKNTNEWSEMFEEKCLVKLIARTETRLKDLEHAFELKEISDDAQYINFIDRLFNNGLDGLSEHISPDTQPKKPSPTEAKSTDPSHLDTKYSVH